MEQPRRHDTLHERTPNYLSSVPIAEVLRDMHAVEAIWPELIAHSPELRTQLMRHHEHIAATYAFVDSLSSGESVETLDARGELDAEQTTRFYECATELLSDEDTRRLLLYLPFEALPPANWEPSCAAVAKAAESFRESYIGAWYHLLGVHDVRTNFDDGDLLEVEHRSIEPERVVKAAHLLPMLVQRRLLPASEALRLFEVTPDPVMKKSLAEAIAILHDLHLIADTTATHGIAIGKSAHPQSHAVSEGRAKWLAKRAKEKLAQEQAGAAASQLLQEATPPADNELVQAEALVHAAKQSHRTTPDMAATYAKNFQDIAHALQYSTDNDTRHRIERGARTLAALGLVTSQFLADLSIQPLRMDGRRSDNIASVPELSQTVQQLDSLHRDPEAKHTLYPAAIAFGSRLKGYATQASDIDIALIAQPNQSRAEREQLEHVVKQYFGDDMPIIIYPERQEELLVLPEPRETSSHAVDRYWVHILMNGAWLGDNQVVHDLQRRLLPAYFAEQSESERSRYLERLEQDTLQYRLMHEGYERHAPLHSCVTSISAAAVDGSSAFWDNGYRRLATKLFVDNVFLPKI